jgi:DNA-binding transcriptional ArsR family regulator
MEWCFLDPLKTLPPAALDHVARYFRTLSEPMRLRILSELGTDELNVRELAERVGSSSANVSRHLSELARYGLVARKQEGNSALYRIEDPVVHDLCELVCTSIARRFEETEQARAAFAKQGAASTRAGASPKPRKVGSRA